jgi:hypothetical protein
VSSHWSWALSFTTDKGKGDNGGSAGVKVARADAPPLIIEGSPDYLPPSSYATARVIVGVALGTTFVENQFVVPSLKNAADPPIADRRSVLLV